MSYTDGHGTAESLTSAQTVAVAGENVAPTTSSVPLAPINEDGGPRLITQTELLANASDGNGDSLTAVGLTLSIGQGTLADNGNGTWTFTPSANDDTNVAFDHTITDGRGGFAAGSATLDLTPVNDAPVITSDGGGAIASLNVVENSNAVTIVSAFDVEGATLWYTIDGGADAAHFSG